MGVGVGVEYSVLGANYSTPTPTSLDSTHLNNSSLNCYLNRRRGRGRGGIAGAGPRAGPWIYDEAYMMITYDNQIRWSYMSIIYDDQMWWSHTMIICDYHISWYTMIIYDHHIWWSYTMTMYDDYTGIWLSYMMIILGIVDDHHIWWSHAMII